MDGMVYCILHGSRNLLSCGNYVDSKGAVVVIAYSHGCVSWFEKLIFRVSTSSFSRIKYSKLTISCRVC
jgi:hypothetical protein